jgi:polysaccharide export outer membrane protein
MSLDRLGKSIAMEKVSLNIFLVDDDQFFLQMYQLQLKSLGFETVSIYNNGAECLDNLFHKPDIIFLDHSMDVLNGLEVLQKIKRLNPDIYVIFISAKENMEAALNSLKYGAFDYIIKGENDLENIKKVLEKIIDIKILLARKQTGIFRRFLPFI